MGFTKKIVDYPKANDSGVTAKTHSLACLRSVGAAVAYRELVMRGIVKPHRMLLYAHGGALLDVDCLKLPRHIKRALTEEASLD